ncbi:MAG TPA: c-type cytochrome [Gemmatimonadales bacterium]|nr:c-type cytochrome [Gemmatimonadales bacterium]
MRIRVTLALTVFLTPALAAQTLHKFPPDSLVNVKVIPKSTPVIDVIGRMRNFTSFLGVRCTFCHVGEEGRPLTEYDFASDDKRPKLVARQMMLMVEEINRRLDTIPSPTVQGLQVTCGTCHRGVNIPMPLSGVMEMVASTAGADSAIRAYKALRQKYYGADAYNFTEGSLNTAAFRLGRAKKFDEAFALLGLNEELFPGSSGMYVFRGNINLMQGDTVAAGKAYREALKRDPQNEEARGRLRAIGQQP